MLKCGRCLIRLVYRLVHRHAMGSGSSCVTCSGHLSGANRLTCALPLSKRHSTPIIKLSRISREFVLFEPEMLHFDPPAVPVLKRTYVLKDSNGWDGEQAGAIGWPRGALAI